MSFLRADALELKVPPVAVALATGFVMWLASPVLPALALPEPWRGIVTFALIGIGMAIGLAGVVSFRRAGTTVNPTRPGTASRVVDSGPYRFTRNPMYLGLGVILAGWGASLSSLLSILAIALFVLYMNRFQIAPEEKALAAVFGEEFLAYRKRVHRWL